MIEHLSLFNIVFILIAFLGYFIGFMFYLMAISHRHERLTQYGNYIAWGAFILHSFSILFRGLALGYSPLANLYETLMFFAWCIVLLFIIINYFYNLRIIGVIILPLACICLGYALIIPKTMEPLPPILNNRLFEIHIVVAFLSYASFVIAFVTGLMYLYQEKQIKSKSKSIWHYRLASLEVLDEVNYRSITFGFPLFTLTIIVGMIWAQQVWSSFWSWQPKQIAAFIIWLFYAILLHVRITAGWRGKKTAYLSIIGFLLVISTYIGLHFLKIGEHNF
ncbi:MAG: c-type cytochrome biogenesis protein CcsB [Candidatus Firestonebacteria bacterium]|nr:c-type cytochrome biogenesis protein CcsB [Candidatus Firestonebacteria bacterium]